VIESTSCEFVWRFFNDRIGLRPSEDFRGILYVPETYRGSVTNMDHVAVGIAYNAWMGRTCFMHTIVQRPELVTRQMIRRSFEYAFDHAGCEAVLAAVESHNDNIMAVVQRLGFKHLVTIPNGSLDGDLVMLIMHRADCHWLRPH